MKSLSFVRARKGVSNPVLIVLAHLMSSIMLAVPAFVLVLLLAFVFPPSEFTGSLLAARQAAYSDLLRLFIVLAALIFAAGFARPFLQYLREGEFEPKRMSSVLVSAFASAAALWLLVLMGLIIFFSVMPSYSGIAFSMILLWGLISIILAVPASFVAWLLVRGRLHG